MHLANPIEGANLWAPISIEMNTQRDSRFNPVKMTAVVCTRNRADLIGQAVTSVLTNYHPDFELIVIDQSSDDSTKNALSDAIANSPQLRYVHTTRVGLSAAYNAGIKMSSGELLAFTDDDCVAPPDWLTSIEQAFADSPKADFLYGQVLLPDSLVGSDGVVPTLAIPRQEMIGRPNRFRVFGMGANFAARRTLFDTVGYFDEVLGGGGPLRSSQDTDFQYRVYQAGLQTLLSPNVKIDHYGLRNADQWPATLLAYGVGDGAFYLKHARCGDLIAIRLFTRRVFREALAYPVRLVRGHRSRNSYLRGLVAGARASFKFSVNRTSRVYVLPPANTPPA